MSARFIAALATLACVLVFGAAAAEPKAVEFLPAGLPLTPGASIPRSIPASLSLPENPVGPVPAVVIAHASAGLLPNGPEPDYVAALNAAGIATLVIDMWTPRGIPAGATAFGGDGGADKRPRTPADTLPDAFGALRFLASQPAIDARRIGILGFSWGAAMSFAAISAAMAERALGPSLRFAAHAGHYLLCWPYLPGNPGAALLAAPWTDAPIELQVAGRDDYDDADGGAGCTNLVDQLPSEKRQRVTLIVHREATHAWDVKLPGPMIFQDRFSHRGRGGPVHVTPDENVTQTARAATVAFFNAAFSAK